MVNNTGLYFNQKHKLDKTNKLIRIRNVIDTKGEINTIRSFSIKYASFININYLY